LCFRIVLVAAYLNSSGRVLSQNLRAGEAWLLPPSNCFYSLSAYVLDEDLEQAHSLTCNRVSDMRMTFCLFCQAFRETMCHFPVTAIASSSKHRKGTRYRVMISHLYKIGLPKSTLASKVFMGMVATCTISALIFPQLSFFYFLLFLVLAI
jgi:hypothetical protein